MSVEKKVLGITLNRWGVDQAALMRRLAQSSYVSLKHKYLYVEVPKAACTTLKYLIHRIENLPPIPATFDRLPETRMYMFIHDRERFQMPSLASLPETKARSVLRGREYYRFAFVRNPYSRLVSAWKNKLYFVEPGMENTYLAIKNAFPNNVSGKYISFDVFIQYVLQHERLDSCNPHYRLQVKLLYDGAIDYDYIGKVENYRDDIENVLRDIGVSNMNQANHGAGNESEPGDWRSYYTEELASLVYSMYEDDFQRFSYSRDSWKGGALLEERTPREKYLEDQIFERNRLISNMYQWINVKSKTDSK